MKNQKVIVAILLALAIVLVVGAGALVGTKLMKPEDIVLSDMKIVLPANATAVEKTAAEELNTYMEKITAKKLEVVTENTPVEAGIYIGDTQFAFDNKVTYPEATFDEGWAIRAVKGNLVINGGRDRGVLYGVYHLLEDELGVRWWTYWEEDVPAMSQVTLAGNYKNSGKPALAWRDIHGGKTSVSQMNVFCVRNRLNGDTANAPIEYGGEEAFGRPAHVHTFNRYFTEQDFETNPEWFAYVNGGRIPNGQLCLTNEDLVREMTNRVLNSIEQSFADADATGVKRPLIYDVSPNDQEEHCNCETCFQARLKKGPSGLLLDFVNKVAKNVAQFYPEVYIETLAYMSYIDAPLDDTKPADNVLIRLCLSSRDVLHGLEHVNNMPSVNQIKDWVAITKDGQLYIWDYCVFYMNPGVSPTVMDYADSMKLMYELGIDGYFGEMENPIMVDFWEMKFWVCAKLMEDPNQDEDALINEFLNGYYGEAGPYLRQYLDLMHERASAFTVHWGYGAETMSPKWIPVDVLVEAQMLMDKATVAVANDPDLLRRVRHARNALDRVYVERHEYYAEEAAKAGIEIPFTALDVCKRIVSVMEEQNEWRGEYDYDVLSYLDSYKRKLAVLEK